MHSFSMLLCRCVVLQRRVEVRTVLMLFLWLTQVVEVTAAVELTFRVACLVHAGHDNCVCCVVAVLSACFAHPPAAAEAAGNPGAGAAEPLFSGPWLNSCQGGGAAPQQQQQGQQQCATPLLPPAPVSKQSVRQQLALVSGAYPLARPTRAMLKQVFNFFEERKRIGQ